MEEEERGGSVPSSLKGSASGLVTVSKEELAQMIAQMVQTHVQAGQKESEATRSNRTCQRKCPQNKKRNKKEKGGHNKMANAKVIWKEPACRDVQSEGRSTSSKETELVRENSKLKKTIKRMRTIMEKNAA